MEWRTRPDKCRDTDVLRDLDLFAFYRWLLAIVCTIYTFVRLGQTVHNWIGYLWAPHPRSGTLRRYALVQLLRIRLSRFTLDLVQLVALTAAFFALLWLHRRLGYVG
jgi:hypothetical protein